MKKHIFLLGLLCLMMTTIDAQSEGPGDYTQEDQVYLSQNRSNGFYLSLGMKYGQVDKSDAAIFRSNLAFVRHDKLEIGLTGTAIITDELADASPRREHLLASYGGMFIAPIIPLTTDLSLTVPLSLGVGVATVDDTDFDFHRNDYDLLFVLEPGVTLDYKLGKIVKVGLAVDYRITNTLQLDQTSIDRLNGISGGIVLKIGLHE